MAFTIARSSPVSSGRFSIGGTGGRFGLFRPDGTTGIVTSGLIYYLDAGRTASYPGSGSTWNDLSEFANTSATLVNGPTFDATGNGSLVFDGANDYASIISAEGRTKFTIGLWVKTTTNASNGLWYLRPMLIGKEFPGANVGDLAITINGGYLGYWVDNPVNGIYESSTLINDGTWKYVVVTSDGTNSRMYLNGQFLSGSTLGVNPLSPYPFQICGNTNRGLYTAASIGSVTFYNRALTPSEIIQNYNAGWGATAFTQPSTTLDTGLLVNVDAGNLASYPGSGSTWTNLADSYNYRNASFASTPSFDSANGGSIVFNGSNYAAITPVAGLPVGSAVRTLSVWFNASTDTNGRYIFALGGNSYNGSRTALAIEPAGIGYYVGTTVNTALTVPNGSWSGLNTWVHLTAVINPTVFTSKVYVNGVLANFSQVGPDVTINTFFGQCLIGAIPDATWATHAIFTGKIASVKLWNRPLSDAEVLQDFNLLRTRFGL